MISKIYIQSYAKYTYKAMQNMKFAPTAIQKIVLFNFFICLLPMWFINFISRIGNLMIIYFYILLKKYKTGQNVPLTTLLVACQSFSENIYVIRLKKIE
ncbi:hypothetical protein TU70_15865 [Bacillus mycoides]|nr:hypothetical protein TU70_15865 [Bacillus mycoides]